MSAHVQAFRQRLVAEIEHRAGDETLPLIDIRTLYDAIVEVLKDGRLTLADLPAVTRICEDAFEQYVRPFDIPGIGPVAEKFVDDLLKSMIPSALMTLFQRLALPE